VTIVFATVAEADAAQQLASALLANQTLASAEFGLADLGLAMTSVLIPAGNQMMEVSTVNQLMATGQSGGDLVVPAVLGVCSVSLLAAYGWKTREARRQSAGLLEYSPSNALEDKSIKAAAV
jgi:hypothetical protein